MARILINFVLIFTIVSHNLMTTWSKNNAMRNTWTRKNITRTLKDMGLIQLIDFQHPLLIAQDVIAKNNGTLDCTTFKTIKNTKPRYYKGVGEMKCHGWIDSCQSYRDDITRKQPAVYCFSDHYKRLTWVRDKYKHQYGYPTGRCRKIQLQPEEIIKSKKDYISNACLCKCTRGPDDHHFNTTQWAFSLQPQISDIQNDRIVTGVRIANHSEIVYLEIKESRIGSYEENNWKSPGPQEGLIPNVDYSFLEPNSRSLNLDKIILPADYAVTGVKFTKIPNTYSKSQKWTLRMEVQGTKLDLTTGKLFKGTSTWFNSDTSADYSLYRGQNRSGILMYRIDPLSPVNDEDEIFKSNTYTMFTTTELKQDLGRFTIPYLYIRPVQSEANEFLNGMSLLYKGKRGHAGYIIPGIYTIKLNIDFKNNVTKMIMTNGNITEPFMNESAENVTILNENQIESGVSSDEEIEESKMKEIKMKTDSEETIGKENTIDASRLESTTEIRNRTNENLIYPSMVNRSNEQGNIMKTEETVKTSTTEAVVEGGSTTERQTTESVTMEISMENKFHENGSSENNMYPTYSEEKTTVKIMSAGNAIGATTENASAPIAAQLESITTERTLAEISVDEKNEIEATTKKLHMMIAEATVKSNTTEATIEKSSMTEGRTMVSITTDENIQKEIYKNESSDMNMPDTYSEEKTTVKIMSAGNAIGATTENTSAPIAAQLESITTEKTLSEISVEEKNEIEATTKKLDMMIAEATVKPSTTEATIEENIITEEQIVIQIPTDRTIQNGIPTSESSTTNMPDTYSEISTTEESMAAENTTELTTGNRNVSIAAQLEPTTTEKTLSKMNVKDTNEIEATTKKQNMILAEATVKSNTTEATIEKISMTEGRTMISITTDESIQEEIYKNESSDMNMPDAHSEKNTIKESMTAENTIELTTENQSVPIAAQTELTTTKETLMETNVKLRKEIEAIIEEKNMVEGQTMVSVTTDRTMQQEIHTSESSDMNMLESYSEKNMATDSIIPENAIELTMKNQNAEQRILAQENRTESTIREQNTTHPRTTNANTLETITAEPNVTTARPSEISTTDIITDEKEITENQTTVLVMTEHNTSIELRTTGLSENSMLDESSEESTTDQIMSARNSIEATTEDQSATITEQNTNSIRMTTISANEPTIEKDMIDRSTSESTHGEETVTTESKINGNLAKETTVKELLIHESVTRATIQAENMINVSANEFNMTRTATEKENISNARIAEMNMSEVITEPISSTEIQTPASITSKINMRNEQRTNESLINSMDTDLEESKTTEIINSDDNSETSMKHPNIAVSAQLTSTTEVEISTEESVKNKIETGATTEEQDMMVAGVAGGTIKTNTTVIPTEEETMSGEQATASITTDKSMRKELRTSESPNMNMLDVYSEKSTTNVITETENAVEATTDLQTVLITDKSMTNIIMNATGVKKAIIKEHEKDRNITESTPSEETSLNKMMSKEKTIEESDEEGISTTVIIEREKAMAPEIMIANTLETFTEAENVTTVRPVEINIGEPVTDEKILAGISTVSTTTQQSMGNELYKSESSDIRKLDAYSEKNLMEEITLPGSTTEKIMEDHSITTASQAKSTIETENLSEESVKERNGTESITETAKASIMETETEVGNNLEKTTTDITTEKVTMRKELVTTEERLREKTINEAITTKENTVAPQSTNFDMKEETDESEMNEFLISLSENSVTEVIPQYELMTEKSTSNIIAENESILVAVPTTNRIMTGKITQKESLVNLQTAEMNTTETIPDEKTMTKKPTIDSITTERNSRNELHKNGLSENGVLQIYSEKSTTKELLVVGNTTEATTKNQNIAIETQNSKSSTSNEAIADTIMQNDKPVMENSTLESITTKKNITEKIREKIRLEITRKGNIIQRSMRNRCRMGRRWENNQDNLANTLHGQIISHVIILLLIILIL